MASPCLFIRASRLSLGAGWGGKGFKFRFWAPLLPRGPLCTCSCGSESVRPFAFPFSPLSPEEAHPAVLDWALWLRWLTGEGPAPHGSRRCPPSYQLLPRGGSASPTVKPFHSQAAAGWQAHELPGPAPSEHACLTPFFGCGEGDRGRPGGACACHSSQEGGLGAAPGLVVLGGL